MQAQKHATEEVQAERKTQIEQAYVLHREALTRYILDGAFLDGFLVTVRRPALITDGGTTSFSAEQTHATLESAGTPISSTWRW